jgi:hypothetical protein
VRPSILVRMSYVNASCFSASTWPLQYHTQDVPHVPCRAR